MIRLTTSTPCRTTQTMATFVAPCPIVDGQRRCYSTNRSSCAIRQHLSVSLSVRQHPIQRRRDVHAMSNVVNDAVVRPTISRRLATDSTVMGNDGTIQERLEKSERMGSTYFEPKNTTINLGRGGFGEEEAAASARRGDETLCAHRRGGVGKEESVRGRW